MCSRAQWLDKDVLAAKTDKLDVWCQLSAQQLQKGSLRHVLLARQCQTFALMRFQLADQDI